MPGSHVHDTLTATVLLWAFHITLTKEPNMLSKSRLQTIVLTSNIREAEDFYRDVLELAVKERSHGAVVFDVGGGDLRVSPVQSTRPSEHTVLGFAVDNVDKAIGFLHGKGIAMERFDSFPHEQNGVLITPDGARVAWFRDPDGNLLSLVQFDNA